jgi:D-alanyl-D-alanine carboxypeptidase
LESVEERRKKTDDNLNITKRQSAPARYWIVSTGGALWENLRLISKPLPILQLSYKGRILWYKTPELESAILVTKRRKGSCLVAIKKPARNLLVICLMCSWLALVSGITHADRVDDYIKKQMQRQHIPGLSLAIVRDGKILKARGYGLANVEMNVPATPSTVYQLASVTKQFTATAIMLLAQEGKISLDDKIDKHVDGTPDIWKEITVRHLLTMTSGIKDYLSLPPENDRQDTTLDKIVQRVTGLPLDFAPGEKYKYSNTNYVLLAIIIQKTSGQPYDAFLAERVFKPLGMTATRRTSLNDVIPYRAAGYTRANDTWQNSAYLNPTLWDNGDGGMLSSVLDLAKWDAALYRDTILTAPSRQQMWTPGKLNDGKTHAYGFGWGVDRSQGHRRIWHSGGRPGTSTIISRYVDDKLTVIILANVGGCGFLDVAERIAGFYVPALAPPVYKPIPDTEPQITAQIKAIMDGFSAGKLSSELLPPGTPVSVRDFPGAINNDKALSEAIRSLGTVQSITLVERKNEGDNRQYRYRVTYRNDSLLFGSTFNKENKMAAFSFQMEVRD